MDIKLESVQHCYLKSGVWEKNISERSFVDIATNTAINKSKNKKTQFTSNYNTIKT
jgi:hypothetical protein